VASWSVANEWDSASCSTAELLNGWLIATDPAQGVVFDFRGSMPFFGLEELKIVFYGLQAVLHPIDY
jgi:hypothetical protein